MATSILSGVFNTFTQGSYNPINYLQRQLKPITNLLPQGDTEKYKDNLSSKLGELKIQSSAYSRMQSIVYGTVRLAGNLLWFSPVKEVAADETTSYKVGGKGGRKVSNTVRNYYYFASFAIAIAEGEIDSVEKVWADTELLNLGEYNHTLYLGKEDQPIEGTIETDLGYDQVPAFRGLAYIVFRDFPLTSFGNRIPNFTFEITRTAKAAVQGRLEQMLHSVIMIPASGEFVYDTVVQSKLVGGFVDGLWCINGQKVKMNQHNNSNKTDALLALDQLQQNLPAVQWVAPVVAWYASSTNIHDCTITPRVEYKHDSDEFVIDTYPDVWQVRGLNRATAPMISYDASNSPRYGGTVNDRSLIRYLQELRQRGYKIMFYPMPMVDDAQKTWRGRITGVAADVASFFNRSNGYNEFILYYARLVKDLVDAIVIGSELVGLTSIRDAQNQFPAVDCLINLAEQVKAIVGDQVKVIYAADWSEYHHTDDGWFNLDKLWAAPAIDLIGIDAYFPLTDNPNTAAITKAEVKAGWESGEGYDWYYLDAERTQKRLFREDNPEEPFRYAWKNIAYWWNHRHYNPDGQATPWVPCSKKIWFTEYGFPSVDGASNQPNVFYDPNSVEGAFPRFSRGQIDPQTQYMCLEATEEYWRDSSMVENKFVWTWDARPHPFFPQLTDIWHDGELWYYGHWLNGKLNKSTLGSALVDLLNRVNISAEQVQINGLTNRISGWVINSQSTALSLLGILQKAYLFTVKETPQQLVLDYMYQQSQPVRQLDVSELLLDAQQQYLEIGLEDEQKYYDYLNIHYIDRQQDYNLTNYVSRRTGIQVEETQQEILANCANITLPLVLTKNEVVNIGNNLLKLQEAQQLQLNFRIAFSSGGLEIGDRFCLTDTGQLLTAEQSRVVKNQLFQVIDSSLDNDLLLTIRAIRAVDLHLQSYSSVQDKEVSDTVVGGNCAASVQPLELPPLNNNQLTQAAVYYLVTPEEAGWKGGMLFHSIDDANYKLSAEVSHQSIAGITHSKLLPALPYCLDLQNRLIVKLNEGVVDSLSSISLEELYAGKNLALVGDELIQFQQAQPNDDGTFTLSILLRGLYHTLQAVQAHTLAERFVLLDNAVPNSIVDSSELGVQSYYKMISFGQTMEEVQAQHYVIQGRSLRPLPPVQLTQYLAADGTLKLHWEYRSRGRHNWQDQQENPLVENREVYQLSLYHRATGQLLRTVTLYDTREFDYTVELQTLDQCLLTTDTECYFEVCQRGSTGLMSEMASSL